MVVAIKKPRARRRKAPVEPIAEPTEKVETKSDEEAQGEPETPTED